jgi:hypothetical protein
MKIKNTETAEKTSCQNCGMTEKEHKNNPWIGKPGHCTGFKQEVNK